MVDLPGRKVIERKNGEKGWFLPAFFLRFNSFAPVRHGDFASREVIASKNSRR